ncbi:MAG: DUF5995 family protein [Anaerolineae bacterium]|nr:DUF5995 family protein [Anaerolineae bacterium]
MQHDHPALTRMTELLAQWERAGDRRAIFLGCYTMMTRNMLAALDAGRFHDAHWVRALLEHFAHYYFDALDACEAGNPAAPVVWRRTFAAAGRPKTRALQNLLLGVNAHVNYDLIFATADLLVEEWAGLSEPERALRHEDFCQVNRIIAETVDEVQDEVLERYAPAMDLADRLFGRLDEWLAGHVIARWRDHVWDNTVRWLEESDEASRAALRQKVEKDALRWAGWLYWGPRG